MLKVVLLLCGTVLISALKSNMRPQTHISELAEAGTDLDLGLDSDLDMTNSADVHFDRKPFPPGERVTVDANGKVLSESEVEDYDDKIPDTYSWGCGSFGRCWSSYPCRNTWAKGGKWCYTTAAFTCGGLNAHSKCNERNKYTDCNTKSSCF